jgi:hypothetical protein
VATDVPQYKDIVTNLSRNYRFNGAAPWTVLQHCVLALRIAEAILKHPTLSLQALPKPIKASHAALLFEVLVHDFAEFVMGDITRPLKMLFREKGASDVLDVYEGICDSINLRFLQSVGAPLGRPTYTGPMEAESLRTYWSLPDVKAVLAFVKLCDNIALYLERHQFFGRLENHAEVWAIDTLFASTVDGLDYTLFVSPQALDLYKAPSIFKLSVEAAEKTIDSVLRAVLEAGDAP